MRTTTLPSMLEILTRNYNFRNKSAKLYELGRTYFAKNDGSGMANEPKVLSLGAYGADMDFFALKGAVETVLAGLRITGVTLCGRERESLLPPRPLRQGLLRRDAAGRPGPDPSPRGGKLRCGLRAVRRGALLRRALRQHGRQGPSISPCPSSPPSPGTSPWCATRRSRWVRWRIASAGALTGLLKERDPLRHLHRSRHPCGQKERGLQPGRCAPTNGASLPKRRTRTSRAFWTCWAQNWALFCGNFSSDSV